METLPFVPSSSHLRHIAEITFNGKSGMTVFYNFITDTINIHAKAPFSLPRKEVVVARTPEAEAYIAENDEFVTYVYTNQDRVDVAMLEFPRGDQWFACETQTYIMDAVATLLGVPSMQLLTENFCLRDGDARDDAPELIYGKSWYEAVYFTAWWKLASNGHKGQLHFNVIENRQIMSESSRSAYCVLLAANGGKMSNVSNPKDMAALRDLMQKYNIERLERELDEHSREMTSKQEMLTELRRLAEMKVLAAATEVKSGAA